MFWFVLIENIYRELYRPDISFYNQLRIGQDNILRILYYLLVNTRGFRMFRLNPDSDPTKMSGSATLISICLDNDRVVWLPNLIIEVQYILVKDILVYRYGLLIQYGSWWTYDWWKRLYILSAMQWCLIELNLKLTYRIIIPWYFIV